MTGEETITISKQEYEQLKLKNERLESEIALLKYQLEELKRMIFGSKSERYIPQDPNQPTLFEIPEEEKPEKPVELQTITRKKPETRKQPLRLEIPAHLPRRTEVIEPEAVPEGARKIGEVVTEILEYEEATIYVRQIVVPSILLNRTMRKPVSLRPICPVSRLRRAMPGQACWRMW